MNKAGSIGVGAMFATLLAGCAVVPPNGPSLVSLPGTGKTYEQFRIDDNDCRITASGASGGPGAAQAATNSAVGSAAVGTVLGAAAGALIGSAGGQVGGGAAVGAGLGLLAGSAVGSGGAQASSYDLQRQYDVTYAQCMSARGNQVPALNRVAPDYPAYPEYGPGAVIVTPGYGYYRPYYDRPYYGRPYYYRHYGY